MIKTVIAVLAVLALAQAAAPLGDKEYEFLFTKWIAQNKKVYHHDEFFSRYRVWRENFDKIRDYNSKNNSATLAMNSFGDLKAEEFKALLGYKQVNRNYLRSVNTVTLKAVDLPTSVDWRTKNAVTPVKDQGQCGSCWAFSTTGAVEGAWAIKNAKLESFSEQQLVDCSTAEGNQGCNGGLMDQGFQYVISHGLCLEDKYPYLATDGTCKASTCSAVAHLTKFVDVAQMDEDQLKAAVAAQPVSVAIEADQSVFQFYSGGVLDDQSCGTQLDHGVLAVGYGNENGKDYWIVKNSWGPNWGDHGYIKLARGKNMCGIALAASYPIV